MESNLVRKNVTFTHVLTVLMLELLGKARSSFPFIGYWLHLCGISHRLGGPLARIRNPATQGYHLVCDGLLFGYGIG